MAFSGAAFPSAPFVPSAEGLVGDGLGPSGGDKAETSHFDQAASLDSLYVPVDADKRNRAADARISIGVTENEKSRLECPTRA